MAVLYLRSCDLQILEKNIRNLNVFNDLVLCYAPSNITQLRYTLLSEKSLELSSNFGIDYATKAINRLKSV